MASTSQNRGPPDHRFAAGVRKVLRRLRRPSQWISVSYLRGRKGERACVRQPEAGAICAAFPLRMLSAPLEPIRSQLRSMRASARYGELTWSVQPVRWHIGKVTGWIRTDPQWSAQIWPLDVECYQHDVTTSLALKPECRQAGYEPVGSTHNQTTGVGPVKIDTNLAPGVSWTSSLSSNCFST